MTIDWVIPKWKAPPSVQAFTTSRNGGIGMGVYRSLNLSYEVGDIKLFVDENRQTLADYMGKRLVYLDLEHGTRVVEIEDELQHDVLADAGIVRKPNIPVAILTADCLPVFFANRAGTVAAIAHAGWRGLAGGILQNVVKSMQVKPDDIMATIGPCITAYGYLVGRDVYEAFVKVDKALEKYFTRADELDYAPGEPKKAHCDLIGIAKHLLGKEGVREVTHFTGDTYRDSNDFFSYRRDKTTGRMASVICLRPIDPPLKRRLISMKDVGQSLKDANLKTVDIEFQED